jgi:predicted Zn-dependent protease
MVEEITRHIKRLFLMTVCLLFVGGTPSLEARALKRGGIIRDSEIEATLFAYAAPIFQAAGLDPKKMHLYVIFDPDLNAAATTEYTIFINTGLLIKARNPEEVIGVLAHETGHIAGGHLERRLEMMKKAQAIAIASAILGGAAIAAGGGDAGAGILTGGFTAADNVMMHYSRGQEAAADQAAVRFLSKLHWPVFGLQDFMKTMAAQELLSAALQDPYSRSHPMSQDRVTFLQEAVAKTSALSLTLPKIFYELFERMVVKLKAFTQSPLQTLQEFPESNKTPNARLARSVAYFLSAKIPEALTLIKGLTAEFPHDPYYWDLQGQISFESGSPAGAVHAYGRAVGLSPKDSLLHMLYAQAILENAASSPKLAETHLMKSLSLDGENPFAWRLLAVAYGKQHKTGMAALCLAEEACAVGNYKNALDQANRALKSLSESQGRLRAHDIVNMAKEALKERGGIFSGAGDE